MNSATAHAVFVSTVRGWGWGAPDFVWPEAAERLLARGIATTLVVHPASVEHPRVLHLRELGADVFPQPPLPSQGGRLSMFLQLMARARASDLARHLGSLPGPHFFFNQGGAFDLLFEPFYHPWIRAGRGTYDLFIHLNVPRPPLPSDEREAHGRLFLGARRCLFNSPWTRETTESQLLLRLPNAAGFSFIPRTLETGPLDWPANGGPARLAYVGRMDAAQKGLDSLLLGLARLPDTCPAWSLDLFGRGPDRGHLEQMAAWLGLGAKVRFHDHTEDVVEIWRTHELLVLPSRYEGLSLAMMEAMACARPVLRTPYGGSEWIENGVHGFICPAAEPELIRRTLEQALRVRREWPSMGLSAAMHLRQNIPSDPAAVYLEPFAP